MLKVSVVNNSSFLCVKSSFSFLTFFFLLKDLQTSTSFCLCKSFLYFLILVERIWNKPGESWWSWLSSLMGTITFLWLKWLQCLRVCPSVSIVTLFCSSMYADSSSTLISCMVFLMEWMCTGYSVSVYICLVLTRSKEEVRFKYGSKHTSFWTYKVSNFYFQQAQNWLFTKVNIKIHWWEKNHTTDKTWPHGWNAVAACSSMCAVLRIRRMSRKPLNPQDRNGPV